MNRWSESDIPIEVKRSIGIYTRISNQYLGNQIK
jgi:hypothetical protein